jgi:Uma2 family endonuclease
MDACFFFNLERAGDAVNSAVQETLVTGAELLDMGDIGPCELIDGRIVPMTPTGGAHGRVESNLAFELGGFVREKGLGWILSGEVGIFIRKDPDRVGGADVAFVSRARAPGGLPSGFLEVVPELIAEVISPTDCWQTIHAKLEDYFFIGVQRVWVVEPEARAVLVYRSPTEAVKLGGEETLQGEKETGCLQILGAVSTSEG